MTSINTNIAAQTAMRTLQATNAQLDATQNRISTGLKIGEAKDNAAYWSISTTLKSDSRSLSTVKDALSLGAATVDIAYQGTNQARSVLEEIQNKLTLASGNSADKAALQAEIKQLQDQLRATAGSSGFSGENWLSVDPGGSNYSPTKSVVSAFNREASGSVTLDTIQIDVSDFALLSTANDTSGILDGGKAGNDLTGGLGDVALVNGQVATSGTITTATLAAEGAANQAFAGSVTVGTTAYAFSLPAGGANVQHSREAMFEALRSATAGGVALTAVADVVLNDDNTISITSKTTGAQSIVSLTMTGTDHGSGLATIADTVDGATGLAFERATTTMVTSFGNEAIELDADDTIRFDIAVDGGRAVSVKVDRAIAIAAGATDGVITSASQYATVINEALRVAGLGNQVQASDDNGNIAFTSQAQSGATSVEISNFAASKGVNILEIDVSTASEATLAGYRDAVVGALGRLTDNAATLGAIASRIELQQSFVSNLMDTIDKGVSGLIDADMNEESTRLQALQVKQQLGVQALAIANQSAQNVLRLFQ